MFANYFYLDQIKNKQVSASITQNLVHYLFSSFIEQGKKVDKEVKNCFDRFCETLKESTCMSSKVKCIKQSFHIWQNNMKLWHVITFQANLKNELSSTFLVCSLNLVITFL